MAENVRPPVAIRIVRPYENEDEFLEAELETVGKTSVILIGAHPRPTGVILRFEVTLTNGATVLRGEGRVLGHKENAFRGQPGLSLRFTRLDPRSKALVDRATSMREIRAAGGPRSAPPAPSSQIPVAPSQPSISRPPPSQPSRPPEVRAEGAADSPKGRRPVSRPDPAIAAALTQETPAPTRASRPPVSQPPPEPIAAVPPPPVSSAPSAPPRFVPPAPSSVEELPTHVETRTDHAPAPIPSAGPRTPGPIAAPPNRDDLLARLRDRATSLPKDRVAAILAARS